MVLEQGEALPMKAYWLTCQMCTVSVETDDNNVITKTPPIVRKFIGNRSRISNDGWRSTADSAWSR